VLKFRFDHASEKKRAQNIGGKVDERKKEERKRKKERTEHFSKKTACMTEHDKQQAADGL